jgi:phosphocarrier protein
MSPDPDTPARRQVTLANPLGLHLRAADRFVRLARTFQSDIRVGCRGSQADGKGILDLLLLAAECGAILEIEARGPDAEATVAALAELVLGQLIDPDETPAPPT